MARVTEDRILQDLEDEVARTTERAVKRARRRLQQLDARVASLGPPAWPTGLSRSVIGSGQMRSPGSQTRSSQRRLTSHASGSPGSFMFSHRR